MKFNHVAYQMKRYHDRKKLILDRYGNKCSECKKAGTEWNREYRR